MLFGTITHANGVIGIKVDGFPSMKYIFYTEREAKRNYRIDNKLQNKRIEWIYV